MVSAATKDMRKEVKKYVDVADDKVVKMFYAMMESDQEDWWDKLPKKVQAEIDEALTELDNGKGIPHEVVMKKYSKWFTK